MAEPIFPARKAKTQEPVEGPWAISCVGTYENAVTSEMTYETSYRTGQGFGV